MLIIHFYASTPLGFSAIIILLLTFALQNLWIGGFVANNGVEMRGFDALKQILAPHFELVEDYDMPFLIRETVRKYQWTVAHTTVWKRVST